MDEHALHELIHHVDAGRLSRRLFVRGLVGLGLTGPMAAQMLAGTAHAQAKSPTFTPTRRGGGGQLKVLWWQAPTLLNPHFGTGTKDPRECAEADLIADMWREEIGKAVVLDLPLAEVYPRLTVRSFTAPAPREARA